MDNIKDFIREYYEETAPKYNVKHGVDLYGNEWGLKHYYLGLIAKFIPDNSRILEIGCGTGKYTQILAKKASVIRGIDISPNMVAAAKERNPGVEFSVGDCEKLEGFGDGQFDVVAGFNVFSYFPRKQEALHSISRVLRKGGMFFDLDMNGASPYYSMMAALGWNELGKWHHLIKESTIGNLSPMLEHAGFEIKHSASMVWIPNALGKTAVTLLIPADAVLSRIPFVKNYAMRILLVAVKK